MCLDRLGKIVRTSVRIAGVMARIQAKHLLGINLFSELK
jgi:hypothetical protein